MNAPTFRAALRFWIKLGWISYGGPAGQIAIMHRELVEKSRWISESSFHHALHFCMLLPGPEAQQLATYLGWKLHGLRGGIAAGLCFILPSALILQGLALLYVTQSDAPWLGNLFKGFQAAVIVIILQALWRMARRSFHGVTDWAIGLSAFSLMAWGRLSFPWIIMAAVVVGWIWGKPTRGSGSDVTAPAPAPPTSIRRTVATVVIGLSLWSIPLLASYAYSGPSSCIFQVGAFFSKAAVVTFGGAYSVLPYVSQMTVDHYHWISEAEMMDGLALAETTPGPLIMVLQFVGFLAGWKHCGSMSPWLAAWLASLMTLWVTFVPCFLLVLSGAPYVESLRRFSIWQRAMGGISAVVVGLIAHLALQFTRHALLPELGSFQSATALMIAAAWFTMRLSGNSVPITLAVSGTLGMMIG